MKRLLLLALLLPAALFIQAQDYSGRWTGETSNLFDDPQVNQVIVRGKKQWVMTTGFNRANIQITLEQSGSMITGTIKHQYINEPGWLVHELSGLIINGHAVLTEGEVTDHANIDRYYFATFEGDITIDSAANKMILKGKVFDRYHKTYDIWTHAMKVELINTGQFTVTKPIVPQPVIKRLPEKPPFTLMPERSITTPIIDSVLIDDWQQRERNIVQTFHVVSDSLALNFYDDSNIDDDTITVYYNRNVLISSKRLTDKPLTIKVPVIPGMDNEIVMFANNVGSIPPNTALLVFYDNGERKEIRIDSDMRKSGTVIFRKK